MVLHDDEKHHSPCGTTTLDNTELLNLLLEKLVFDVFTLNEKKKILFCAVLFTSQETEKWQTVDCKIERVLFSAFYSFYTVFTGAHLISQPCYIQAHCLDLHKQKVKLATWEMMFSVIRRKKKKKLKIKVCGELLFSSFILTNDITVQLLVSVVAGGRVARPGNSPPQLPPL